LLLANPIIPCQFRGSAEQREQSKARLVTIFETVPYFSKWMVPDMIGSTKKPYFIHLFAGALVLTSVLSVLLGWHILDSYNDSRRIQSRDIRLLDLSWTVFHRDEILTMSARMAAYSGESKWEQQYKDFEPEIAAAFEKIATLELESQELEAVSGIENAHKRLDSIEDRAFELVRQGDRDAAVKLLSSYEYEELQHAFLTNINKLMGSVRAGMDSMLYDQSMQARHMAAAVAVTLPILLISWLFVLNTIRRYLRERDRAGASLRRSEEKYRELVESANSIILSMDAEGRVTFFNKFAQNFFGYSPDEIHGRNIVGTIVPERDSSGKDLEALMGELLRNPDLFKTNENENMRKDGERVWVAWTNRSILDEHGNLVGVLSIGNDITARRRAELALEVDEARFEALFELSRMTERSTKEIVDFALKQLIELTKSEIGFLGFMDEEETVLMSPSWSDAVLERCKTDEQFIHFPVEGAGLWAEPVRTRQPMIVNDYLAPHPGKRGYPEGHRALFRFMSVPIFQGGRMVALVAMANKQTDYDASDTRQITLFLDGVWKLVNQQRTQDELRKSEERYRTLVETMNEGLGVQDENRTIIYVNDKFCEVLGYSREELIGRPLVELFDETSRSVLEEQIKHRIKGFRTSYEALWKRKDGRAIPVLISAAPIFDADGAFNGSIGTLTDISDRKQAEEALKSYASKLERTNQELQEFTFIGSHHMQEPLRKIQILSDLISTKYRKVLDDRGRDYLERLNRSAKAARDQVQALLSYSSLCDEPESYGKVSLRALAQEALDEFSADIEEAGMVTEVEGLCDVEANREQMVLLFKSLAENALKFRREERPYIRIHAGKAKGMCRVLFEDNGIGFDEKYLDRIFKPFQTLRKGDEPEGVGMGLALCRKIVEWHNGTISARSAPGKGTTLIITLPIRRAQTSNNPPPCFSCAA